MATTSMAPDTACTATPARGQLERDRLAGDEVVVADADGAAAHGSRAYRRPASAAPTRPGGDGPRTRVTRVDLDAFVAAHRAEWHRLDELVRRRRLDGAEADELVDLYQRVATHLSVVRSAAPDPAWSPTCPRCWPGPGPASAGTRTTSWADARRFFTATFPAALYRTRRWWLVTDCWPTWSWRSRWAGGSSRTRSVESVADLAGRDRPAASTADFERYYSEFAASHFAAQVWTNNAWVAALCIALGVLGLPVRLPAVPEHPQRRA